MVLSSAGRNPKRMIVLLPECLVNDMDLARKVYLMASRSHCDVLYFTLLIDNSRTLSVSRSMATLKALTSGDGVLVQSKLVDRSRWLKALQEICKPGDQIVCHEEQCVSSGFLRTIPMQDFLRNEFTAPIATLSGFYHPQTAQLELWFSSLTTWVGFLFILGGFTFLEVQVDGRLNGVTGKVLIFILILVELGAIWIWNTIMSH